MYNILKHKAKILFALLIVGALTTVFVLYVEPKLTLFSQDKIVHNFANMEDVFPSNEIQKSSKPHHFEISPQAMPSSFSFSGKDVSTDEFLKRSKTTGLLVIKDGNIVHEKYYQGYTADTRATSFSVAKSFVSTLIGIAIDEGRISNVHDPIIKYVPELEDSGFAKVRISDALQMSSGIDFSEEYDGNKSDAYKVFDELFVFMRPLDNVIKNYGSNAEPGTKFYYSSLNTQALSMLLRRIYGQSLSTLIQRKLWEPLGMTSNAYWNTDNYGDELGFMGLNMTLRDYAKFGLLFLHQGKFEDQQVVSKNWVNQALSPDKDFLQRGQIYGDWGYQYQWWLPRGSETDFAAVGIWGQMIYVDPEAGIVIVKTSADADFHSHEFEAITLFRHIAMSIQ